MIDFNLTPIENIAYLQAKRPKTSFNYDEIMHEAHQKAFTVAKISKIDLLNDINTSLQEALAKGQSFNDWKKSITPTLAKKGWLGKVDAIDPRTGEVKTINVNQRRLRTIYQTNMRTSYTIARAREQYALEGEIYLRYVAIDDGRARESHKKLHGLILSRDDEFWERCYPPNGWRCRCSVSAYTKEQLNSRGWSVSPRSPFFTPHKDWDYDTRALKKGDLEHLIQTKLKAHQSNPDAVKALKGIQEQITSRSQRFKRVDALFNAKDINRVESLCATPMLLKSLFKNGAKDIKIKADTMIAHKPRHPEIGSFDYSLMGDMLDEGNIDSIYQDKVGSSKYLFVNKLDKWYRLSLKNLPQKDEIWVESLVGIGTKEAIMKGMGEKTKIYSRDNAGKL